MSGYAKLKFEEKTSAHARRHPGGAFAAGALMCIALAAAAEPVRAADILSSPETPVNGPALPPPEFVWTGFYVGVNVGGGIDHFAFPFFVEVPGPYNFVRGTNGITAAGPAGGIQAGFNYELPFFHIVAGIEIDSDASGITGLTTVNGVLLSGLPVNATFGTRFEDFGTGRLRLGYAWGRFMPYLAGGFTYARIETSFAIATAGFLTSGAVTETRSGVIPRVATIGIGAEYAIAPNLTVKAEYLYDYINARQIAVSPAPGTIIEFNTRTAYHIGRVGLNYKFDWLSPPAGPLAAKY